MFNQLRGSGYQRKQSFLRLICLFPLRPRKKIQEPEKQRCLATDRNGFLKACYDNTLNKFFVTAIRKIPFQITRPQNIQPIFEYSTILNWEISPHFVFWRYWEFKRVSCGADLPSLSTLTLCVCLIKESEDGLGETGRLLSPVKSSNIVARSCWRDAIVEGIGE